MKFAIVLILASVLFVMSAFSQKSAKVPHTDEWITSVLKEIQTIRPGMTRTELLTVFTTEGGLSTGLARTYVYRGCPYIKVDVTFDPVGRPPREKNGRVTCK